MRHQAVFVEQYTAVLTHSYQIQCNQEYNILGAIFGDFICAFSIYVFLLRFQAQIHHLNIPATLDPSMLQVYSSRVSRSSKRKSSIATATTVA